MLNGNRQVLAPQIATLLNKYNNLDTLYNPLDIIQSQSMYLTSVVRLSGKEYVAGCVAILRVSSAMSEIKHLSVDPFLRKEGIGTSLVEKAIAFTNTYYYYATVRKDNAASLGLFKKLGFITVIEEANFDNLSVALVIKKNGLL